MASSTIDKQREMDELKSAFDSLRAQNSIAMSTLTSFAQWNDGNAVYPQSKGLLWEANTHYPVEPIIAADSIIDIIMGMVANINAVTYVPPVSLPNFQMEDHKIWQDALADKIEAGLSDYIDTMGIPNAAYQNAIFNESYDRNLQVLNDLTELADAKTGARGFTYPNSMTTVLKLDAQQKYQFDRSQVGRDVTKLVTEWARHNYQFAIDKGISLEQFHADFTYKYCTAFVDIYKNLVLTSIERFKADLSKYVEPIRALVEAAKLPVEVAQINAGIGKENAVLGLEDNKQKIEEATKVFNTKMQGTMATFQNQIHALEAVATNTAGMANSVARQGFTLNK